MLRAGRNYQLRKIVREFYRLINRVPLESLATEDRVTGFMT